MENRARIKVARRIEGEKKKTILVSGRKTFPGRENRS